mmetsp:Transcript_3937/g.7213  ORF Transcript_3937/g.7213 Transcript_3937/m.7213 type:complete len:625 (-) Transcript_3937:43-1917(-)
MMVKYGGILSILLGSAHVATGCTSIAVSAGATVDGVPMTSHSDDCVECDARMALVPARDHEQGAKHPVYGMGHLYPRKNGNRAAIYVDQDELAEVVGNIPEVEHTLALWEATYPLINEAGLSFGESTCDTKISSLGVDMADPKTGEKGPALFSISALMQVGLERCKTAVCAIKVMGEISEKYGFYGEGPKNGETLTIADATGEAWVFHIIQDYTTNASSIWAAQRVPEGHISAIANEFVIRDIPIDEDNSKDYLFSKNIRSEAMAAGLWDGTGSFSWIKVFGAAPLPYYISIRIQWIYSQVAPSMNFTLVEDNFAYPFSVPVDNKLTKEDLMTLYRSHYEGTDFDMTKGILAGPFGNPRRIEGGVGSKMGQFARDISIPRTAYTHIGYADAKNGAAFFATDEPTSSVFAPFLVSTLKQASAEHLNETLNLYSPTYQVGTSGEFDRSSAWWAFDIVANWMNLNFRNMSIEIVYPAVQEWQDVMKAAHAVGTTEAATKAQNDVVAHWWKMFELLIVRYNDGTYNFYPGYPKDKPHATIGYPEEYLKDIGYDKSFFKAVTFQDQIKKACGKDEEEYTYVMNIAYNPLVTLALGLLVGLVLGSRFAKQQSTKDQSSRAAPLLAFNNNP